MLLALLLPDPCDEHCPGRFKEKARQLLVKTEPTVGPTDHDLRKALLDFIGDFANWDNSSDPKYLEVGRGLVKAAHPEETPLVVDPFAGGGSIPLEALRLGCDAFAGELNPVACLILQAKLVDIPRHGHAIADKLLQLGTRINENVAAELSEFYPVDTTGARPIAYIWVRTIKCESPNCGADIPLIRGFWLCKKAGRQRALRHRVVRPSGCAPDVEFEVFEPHGTSDVSKGTVSRAKAVCLCCGNVLSPERVRTQLSLQQGGADTIFDEKGNRIGGARLLAVVTLRPGETGRHYRLASKDDYMAVFAAQVKLRQILDRWECGGKKGLRPVPDEPTPVGGGSGAGRAFSVQKYGIMTFGQLFSARQRLALATYVHHIQGADSLCERELLALVVSKTAERNNSVCDWMVDVECPGHLYTQQVIPAAWDFAEAVPIGGSSGSFQLALKNTATNAHACYCGSSKAGDIAQSDATDPCLPDASSEVFFTDPPYYDAVPYSDLSDFFYVWLRRALPEHPLLHDPFAPTNPLSPKGREIVQDEVRDFDGHPKDRLFFERRMGAAFSQGKRVLQENGIGCVVFAHKTTEGWEALLSGMIRGGWTITGSWPIATERSARMRARESAALESSVHLVCRPRPGNATVGDWSEVLRELPKRVADWMERLQNEGVRGADLVFACIGPALEIYSKYSKVEDAQGHGIPLGGNPEAADPHERGFLAYVWETVGRVALEQVLGTAEAKARNGAAGAVEEDARLTALFLWTLQGTNGKNGNGSQAADDTQEEVEEPDEDEEETTSGKKTKGFTLVYDVVRRFAQPLGIHLPDWEGRILETNKGVVRLLAVSERAKQLFGDAGASAVADRLEEQRGVSPQMLLFPEMQQAAAPNIKARRKKADATVSDDDLHGHRGATTLDRVHAAMLLQASGRANALRALIKAEQQRGPDFLRLANALSALYPVGSEEKRLLDAMLLAVPR
jgi:hypothetical protein